MIILSIHYCLIIFWFWISLIIISSWSWVVDRVKFYANSLISKWWLKSSSPVWFYWFNWTWLCSPARSLSQPPESYLSAKCHTFVSPLAIKSLANAEEIGDLLYMFHLKHVQRSLVRSFGDKVWHFIDNFIKLPAKSWAARDDLPLYIRMIIIRLRCWHKEPATMDRPQEINFNRQPSVESNYGIWEV